MQLPARGYPAQISLAYEKNVGHRDDLTPIDTCNLFAAPTTEDDGL